MTAGLAAALAPQTSDATIITVGGDGGVASVTLSDPGDASNLGGLLIHSIAYGSNTTARQLAVLADDDLFPAIRSNLSSLGSVRGGVWTITARGVPREGAVLGSTDNWVPGHFSVNGVNGGADIWGWLQVGLGASAPNLDPTIISFTYDDAATDATPFAKPVGGFSAVPEPSTLGLLGLGLGAAAVSRLRRRKRKVSPA